MATRSLPCVRGTHLLQMLSDCFWCKMSLVALMALWLSIFKWERTLEQPGLMISVPKGETWALLWSCCSPLCQAAISSADGEYYLDEDLFIPWWPNVKEHPRLALSLLKILCSDFFFPCGFNFKSIFSFIHTWIWDESSLLMVCSVSLTCIRTECLTLRLCICHVFHTKAYWEVF